MFVKLNFTVNKLHCQVQHLFHHIITNSNITNITEFANSLSGFDATTYSGLDVTTSEIVRTNNPDRVVSHIRKNTTSTGHHTMQFDVSSMTSKKYFIQTRADGSQTFYGLSDTLTGSQDLTTRTSAINSTIWDLSGSSGDSTTLTTSANSADTTAETAIAHTTSSVRTAWFYLTNECYITSLTLGNSLPVGWTGTSSYARSSQHGPMIFSQYQPFDVFMKPENGIIPVMFTSLLRDGGFNYNNDISQINNVLFTKPTTVQVNSPSFQVLNAIDATPLASSAWPRFRAPYVSWGSGSRTNDQFALTTAALGAVGTLSTPRAGRVINTAAFARYVSSDRKTNGHAMLPLRWELSYYNLRGGNASALGGMFIFNGDYVAGDLFTHNNKTYMIWPTAAGYAQRVGIAIPKE